MKTISNVTIIIPAYNPDEKLLNLVDQIEQNFTRIIVVNDGSNGDSQDIFDQLAKSEKFTILKHAVNLGKGRALKTAFNHFLNNHNESIGIVTVDADGQHSVEDIKKVALKLNQRPNSLILGVRDFSEDNIPLRSRFGNILTKRIFSFASGIKISDTQTGLRGISYAFLKELLNVKGERFEYEMNMLFECKNQTIRVEEVDIETIYIEENKSSHFNPIVDSIKIYSIFLQYAFSSLSSFGLDILLFSILSIFLKDLMPQSFIIVATIGARILSSIFNYTLNKNLVFKSNSKSSLYKYYVLSISQMLSSSLLVYVFYLLIGDGEVAIKIVVDSLLFIISFYIQRLWVFDNDPGEVSEVIKSV
ncbi:bifunctional glycosyltransferase family 2/GtrA family protein [Virgibacillus litoralis]|uniref:Glycosyltransferase involved in cell wall biosynthesis n=1 Tax=Virgibacillus litoralis TaxID=578221 RepID=A0ABS4HCZ8_9BACI|nr:bifunctional glycosyltransferase family 2/GtrA family protein [Virgibacillus litoralis]MBP1948790.1 glycosyltransferase involved in cell wall biosynthesis [Virgibacillus litoralis]